MTDLYDPNSCANINDYQTTHLHMELEINFEKSVLKGHVQLSMKKVTEEERPVLLDCAALAVSTITCDHPFLSVRVFLLACLPDCWSVCVPIIFDF